MTIFEKFLRKKNDPYSDKKAEKRRFKEIG